MESESTYATTSACNVVAAACVESCSELDCRRIAGALCGLETPYVFGTPYVHETPYVHAREVRWRTALRARSCRVGPMRSEKKNIAFPMLLPIMGDMSKGSFSDQWTDHTPTVWPTTRRL